LTHSVLVPHRVLISPPGRTPYFTTKYKKIGGEIHSSRKHIHIVSARTYKGDLKEIYIRWIKFVGGYEGQDKDHLLIPVVALQEIIYSGHKGLLAIMGPRVVGIVSFKDVENRMEISILSPSPIDIAQNRIASIQALLRQGAVEHAKKLRLRIQRMPEQHSDYSVTKQFSEWVENQSHAGLVPKKITETVHRGGKTFPRSRTAWVKPGEGAPSEKPKAAEEESPEKKPSKAPEKKLPKKYQEWPEKEEGQKVTPGGRIINPGSTSVRVNPDPKAGLQAVGITPGNRVDYMYAADFKANKAVEKFQRVKDFDKALPALNKRVEAELATSEEAQVIYLIWKTAFRVGSTKDTQAKTQAYGASTLLGKHVSVEGDIVKFAFTGKKGVQSRKTVKDQKLADMISAKETGPNDRLFDTDGGAINKYIGGVTKDIFTAKDYRTWHGTVRAKEAIAKAEPPKNPKEYKDARNAIGDIVSKFLGNTRDMALGAYIQPELFTPWEANLGISE
jgi:DNA topoisomerase-1